MSSALDSLLLFNTEILLSLIANRITSIALQHDHHRGTTTTFHAKHLPQPLLLQPYLTRLVSYTPYPKDSLLLALLSLHHITPLFPSLPPTNHDHHPLQLSSYTVQRLLLAALQTNAKFISDAFIPHTRAAKVGGVNTRELVRIEVAFMNLLDWNLSYQLSHLNLIAIELLQDFESTHHLRTLSPSDLTTLERIEGGGGGEGEVIEEAETIRVGLDSLALT